MKEALPIKETVKISTTSNPYLTGEPTRWPIPEWYLKEEIEALRAELTGPSKVKPQRENDK